MLCCAVLCRARETSAAERMHGCGSRVSACVRVAGGVLWEGTMIRVRTFRLHEQLLTPGLLLLFGLQDNGKPLYMSKIADIPLSIDHFRYYAGWAVSLPALCLRCCSLWGDVL